MKARALAAVLLLSTFNAFAQPAGGRYDSFLRNLVAIAQHGHLGDAEFLEKTLSVRVEPKPGSRQTRYDLDPPAGSPLSKIVYGYQPGPPGSGGFITFLVDPTRHCIPDVEVRKFFAAPQNDSIDGENRQLIFEIRGKQGFTTAVYATFAQKPALCVREFRFQVGYRTR